MAPVRLTYCGNVHAAPDLDAMIAALREHTVPVAAAARAAGRTFGLGAWWPAAVVAELAGDPAALARFAAVLRELDLPLWTLNVFPYGGFHDDVVKTAVYRPDWAHEDRLRYTVLCAEVGAALVAAGRGLPPATLPPATLPPATLPPAILPLSTLPLGYRGPGEAAPDLRVMARNLARCASAFAAIEERTGVRCVLAIEPEPDCLLETCAATAAFLERWLFDEGAWPTIEESVLRRHLGVCVDLCHLAVVGEDPLAALADLRTRGIEVAKIQVSACLELRDGRALDQLLAFAEPRYLHQTAAHNGARALDLPDVAARRAEFSAPAAGVLRSHYHVPLFWDAPGALGSTQREVERVLRALAMAPEPLPLLEVETYTWSVLGDFAGRAPLHRHLQHELDQVASWLAPRSFAP